MTITVSAAPHITPYAIGHAYKCVVRTMLSGDMTRTCTVLTMAAAAEDEEDDDNAVDDDKMDAVDEINMAVDDTAAEALDEMFMNAITHFECNDRRWQLASDARRGRRALLHSI